MEFTQRIDRQLAYLGRYGHQNMFELERRVPMVTIYQWSREISTLLERENPPT